MPFIKKDYRLYTDCFENNVEHKGELWKQVDLPHGGA